MRFCTHCGSIIEEDWNFCVHCGFRLPKRDKGREESDCVPPNTMLVLTERDGGPLPPNKKRSQMWQVSWDGDVSSIAEYNSSNESKAKEAKLNREEFCHLQGLCETLTQTRPIGHLACDATFYNSAIYDRSGIERFRFSGCIYSETEYSVLSLQEIVKLVHCIPGIYFSEYDFEECFFQ